VPSPAVVPTHNALEPVPVGPETAPAPVIDQFPVVDAAPGAIPNSSPAAPKSPITMNGNMMMLNLADLMQSAAPPAAAAAAPQMPFIIFFPGAGGFGAQPAAATPTAPKVKRSIPPWASSR